MKKFLLTLVGAFLAFSAGAVDYYLIGGFNSWTLKQAACKFTDAGDGTYTLDYKGTLTTDFKINDGTWSGVDLGSNGSKLVVGTAYTLATKGGNITMDGNVVNPHLVLNPTAKTLLVTGEAAEAKTKYGIHGDIFGNPSWSTEDFTESNGKWVMSNKTVVAGNFGIKAMDAGTGAQTAWISSAGAAAVTLNSAMACKVEGTNWSLNAGTYTFTFDPTAMTLTVTGQSSVVTYPEQIFVVGNVNDGAFAPNNTVALAGADGVYEGDVTFTGADGTEFSYFQFSTATGSSATDWAGLGTRYGSSVADADPAEKPELTRNDMSWKVENGTYTVTVSLVEMTVVLVKKTEPDPTPTPQPLEVTFNFGAEKDILAMNSTIPASTSWTADQSNCYYDVEGKELTSQNVVMTATSGASTAPRVYKTSKGVYTFRVYKSNDTKTGSITFTAPEGYLIKDVKFYSAAAKSTSNIEALLCSETGVTGASLASSLPTDFKSGYSFTCTKAVKAITVKTGTSKNVQITAAILTLEKGNDIPTPEYPVLYLRGAINNWVAEEANKMTCTDGIYTITVDKLTGNFKIGDAEWSADNSWTTNNTAMELDTEYACTTADASPNMAMANTIKDATVTFNINTKKLKVTGTVDNTPAVITYQIKGQFTEPAWEAQELTKEGDVYTWKGNIAAAEGEMLVTKLSDGVEADWYKAADATTVISAENKEVTLVSNGASNLHYSFTAGEEVTFTFDPATLKLTATVADVPTPEYPVLYLRGAINDWVADETSKMTCTDGVYTITVDKLTGNFKIADAEWSADNSWTTDNTAMEPDTEYACTTADASPNMAMANTIKDATVTFNINTKKLKVTGTVDNTPAVITYKIKGTFTEPAWEAQELTKEGDVYTWKGNIAAAEGEMLVTKLSDGVEADWYKAADATTVISAENKEVSLVSNGASNLHYSFTAGEEVTFTFDPATLKLTATVADVPTPEYPVLYLRGAINNWVAEEANKMTCTDGVYTITVDKLTGNFKIADAEWSADNSWTTDNTAMELDTEYACTTADASPNMAMANTIKDATVTFNINTKKLKVTGTVDNTPAVITYQIKGTFTDPAWEAQDMTENTADGTYSWTGSLAAETGVLLVVELKDGVESAWMKATAGTTLSATNADITLVSEGGEDVAYDFTGADVKEITFTFDPATKGLKASWTTGIIGLSADYDANATYYNLHGVRVDRPAPGLYIVVRGTNVTKEYLR